MITPKGATKAKALGVAVFAGLALVLALGEGGGGGMNEVPPSYVLLPPAIQEPGPAGIAPTPAPKASVTELTAVQDGGIWSTHAQFAPPD